MPGLSRGKSAAATFPTTGAISRKTVTSASTWISFVFVSAVVVLSLLFPLVIPMPRALFYLAGATAAGVALLLVPISRWLHRQTADEALRFFNLACFYPLAVFGWLAITVLI